MKTVSETIASIAACRPASRNGPSTSNTQKIATSTTACSLQQVSGADDIRDPVRKVHGIGVRMRAQAPLTYCVARNLCCVQTPRNGTTITISAAAAAAAVSFATSAQLFAAQAHSAEQNGKMIQVNWLDRHAHPKNRVPQAGTCGAASGRTRQSASASAAGCKFHAGTGGRGKSKRPPAARRLRRDGLGGPAEK